MFQRSGMKHHLRTVLGEGTHDRHRIPDVTQHKAPVIQQGTPLDRQLNRVQRRFIPIEHDETGGHKFRYLPAELRSNRPACPCYKNSSSRQITGNEIDSSVHYPAT